MNRLCTFMPTCMFIMLSFPMRSRPLSLPGKLLLMLQSSLFCGSHSQHSKQKTHFLRVPLAFFPSFIASYDFCHIEFLLFVHLSLPCSIVQNYNIFTFVSHNLMYSKKLWEGKGMKEGQRKGCSLHRSV